MAGPYSITIQVSYDSLLNPQTSHLAVVINTPTSQTYAGFGPSGSDFFRDVIGSWSRGQYDVQVMQYGAAPMTGPITDGRDFSTVIGHNNIATFTLPGTASQAMTTLIWIQGREMASIYYGDSALHFARCIWCTVVAIKHPVMSSPRNGFAVIAGGARQLRRASKDDCAAHPSRRAKTRSSG